MRKNKVGLSLLVVALLFLSVYAEGAQKNLSGSSDQSLRKGETRATMDPNMFSDKRVRAAYQAAKEIPWVLDSIYCYCQCAESPVFKHKSLLSCYVDNHAAV
jgi:hypothetical protein